MENGGLEELKKEGKGAFQELEGPTQKEYREAYRQIVSMIAKAENVVFDELWGMFKGGRGIEVNFPILDFLMPEHAPIEYWYFTRRGDKRLAGWYVWTGASSYHKRARNLGKAIAIAKRTFENTSYWR